MNLERVIKSSDKVDLIFNDNSSYSIDKENLNSHLGGLIIRLLDSNFKYDTAKNIFPIDNLINYLRVSDNTVLYIRSISLKNELYLDYYFNERLTVEREQIFFQDYFTYFVGAYANLQVLFNSMNLFIRENKLKFPKKLSKKIQEFQYIRNKILIHGDEHFTLMENYIENDINNLQYEGIIDEEINFYYIKDNNVNCIDLATEYISFLTELQLVFIDILIQNNKNLLDSLEFNIREIVF
ncbi:hypothetical protein [Turicibacter sanguinis]|uniref:hypothetical protein n=1 Tax=Turicibacter sanguinis TaxID=154288 RepID=UPI0006C079E8|nr:hypothetical protein [Turicibacter sanguinis]CUN11989.1 Uncharacterised protein [Turicibacter sanguinis]